MLHARHQIHDLQPAHNISGIATPPGLVSWPDSVVLAAAYPCFAAWLLIMFLYARFIVEPFLPRTYGDLYVRMSLQEQRSFACHHIWLTTQIISVSGLYAVIAITARSESVFATFTRDGVVTYADQLSILYMLIIATMCFELIYKTSISIVSLLHHSGAICLSIWQISDEMRSERLGNVVSSSPTLRNIFDTQSLFKLIMIYGSFEVVFESWSHVASILHRVHRRRPDVLSKIWGIQAAWVLTGSILELGVVIAFWTLFWPLWSLEYRLFLPILHCAFMASQLHGAVIGCTLHQRFQKEAVAQQQPPKSEMAVNGSSTVNPAGPPFARTPGLEYSIAPPYGAPSDMHAPALASPHQLPSIDECIVGSGLNLPASHHTTQTTSDMPV